MDAKSYFFNKEEVICRYSTVNKKHLTGTVPANKEHLTGTLYIFRVNEGEMLMAIS